MSGGDWKDMYAAARSGDLELVRFHADAGIDLDHAHPEFQSTALVAACAARQEEVALFLLDRGADPALRSVLEQQTPVEAAREAGLEAVVSRLVELGELDPGVSTGGSGGRPRRRLKDLWGRGGRG